MDDSTALIAGHSKRYNIPLSHFEHKYLQNCTDGKELERIYKELKDGEMGSFPDLEKLTLEQLAKIKPNSQILRQDKPPSDRSALPPDELESFNDFLQKMNSTNQSTSVDLGNNHNNHGKDCFESVPIRSKATATVKTKGKAATPSALTTTKNTQPKRILPRSYDEWGKLEKSIGDDLKSDEEDDEEKKEKPKASNPPAPTQPVDNAKERLQRADAHRLSGNEAFRSNNYQESIDSYTKSIQFDDNSLVYMNRALAHFRLKNYDASLADCSYVLSREPNHIKALFRRASCRLAKEQYDEAKTDLEHLLRLEPTNLEAKNLLKSIPAVQKPKSVRIPITEDEDEEEQKQPSTQTSIPSGPVKIPIMEVDEEEDEDDAEISAHQPPAPSLNIDIPTKATNHSRPGIDSQDASPAMFEQYFPHSSMQYPISSHDTGMNQEHRTHRSDEDDDDDDLPLGGEASNDLIENMSDDEGHTSRNFTVSPTAVGEEEDDDDNPPELINVNHLSAEQDRAVRTGLEHDEAINRSIAFRTDNTYNQQTSPKPSSYHHPNIQEHDMNVDQPDSNATRIYSSPKTSSYRTTSIVTAEYSSSSCQNDVIANSNFCPTIQNWLHESAEHQSNRPRSSAIADTWSKPFASGNLKKLHDDIARFHRLSDFGHAIEASKKLLTNGQLDYHHHAEQIVNTLVLCAQFHAKVNKHICAIQYATEALQYNKTDTNALLCRARAFENEDCLVFSYADYARIPSRDPGDNSIQKLCDSIATKLFETKGDAWREELPDYTDDELYLKFIRMKDQPNDDDFDWHRVRGNQLYLDGCYILAIRCYTICIELKPKASSPYLNRAACFLKVFEQRKAIDDCDRVLELDPNNVRALYRKACAFKMANDLQSYISLLQYLLKLQPNNQTLLSEYYNYRREPIPRQKRRLRGNPTTTVTNASSSAMKIEPPAPVEIKPVEVPSISYEQLETSRKKIRLLSSNTGYQFVTKLNQLREEDVEGQCQLMLSVPNKMLYSFAHNASPKLVEMILRVCQAMISAEKSYLQPSPSTSPPFSYTQFCFQLLVQLTTLPRLDSALGMIGSNYHATLNELLTYYSSVPALSNELEKLNRLRQ